MRRSVEGEASAEGGRRGAALRRARHVAREDAASSCDVAHSLRRIASPPVQGREAPVPGASSRVVLRPRRARSRPAASRDIVATSRQKPRSHATSHMPRRVARRTAPAPSHRTAPVPPTAATTPYQPHSPAPATPASATRRRVPYPDYARPRPVRRVGGVRGGGRRGGTGHGGGVRGRRGRVRRCGRGPRSRRGGSRPCRHRSCRCGRP